ncbi:ring-opening amidohydrolase [Falsiroseomonas sp.]|uniref:ring-opening amidohydrolase n=1 Tax=Falsiroseomonas sp. TaxID=2870721 RepID=UPI003F71CFF6
MTAAGPRMNEARVMTVPMNAPEDVSAVARLFDDGVVDPAHVVALIAQTEGDGHARGYAATCLQLLFAERLGLTRAAIFDRIPMLMIGGTAGLMSPHITLFVNIPGQASVPGGPKRLAIGVTSTRALLPEEYGTPTHVALVAEAVRAAMAQAGIESPDDVACVEMKCPQMTATRAQDAASRGAATVHPSAAAASSMSRGASALGCAVALGEVSAEAITQAAIAGRPDLFTQRGSASSGNEQVAVRVVVIGNVAGAPGFHVAARGVMAHQLDLAGARAAFTAAGLRLVDGMVVAEDRPRLAAAFVNAGADSVGDWQGRRHTMLSDMLAGFSGHVAKAVAHAAIAGIAQETLVLGNAGAEHQGAPGSNLVCVIARGA